TPTFLLCVSILRAAFTRARLRFYDYGLTTVTNRRNRKASRDRLSTEKRVTHGGQIGWCSSIGRTRGFGGGVPKNLEPRTPSLVRVPQLFVVCSTPMRVR